MPILLATGNARAEGNADSVQTPPDIAGFTKRAEKAFNDTKTRYEADTNNAEAAWQFGRACYDWADYAATDARKAEIARLGIAACRNLVEKDTNSVLGHYYLAMDMGQLADARRGFEGLKIVGQMEAEFKIALGLDSKVDYAGPDRNLGLLYWQTPGWPISLGSKAKARLHLQEALKIAPDYPENHLNLLEAELKWGDTDAVLRGLKALDELWPAARKKLTGDEWASSWADWDKRLHELEKKTNTLKAAETPRKKP